MSTMTGVVLPGNRQLELREFSVPEPGHGQVLVRMKASSLCGSDLRAIYRPTDQGMGPEAYRGVIAGHEPCGIVDDRRLGNTLIRSPRIVIEVLSPGTEATDRGEKLQAYKACASIQEYLLISQFAQHVEIYQRDSGDETIWRKQEYGPAETVELRSIDIAITMDEIYQGIDFTEFLKEE